MKGSIYRHDVIVRTDEATGQTVRQLTSLPGNHHHLYFTSNSFTTDNRDVLFISDQSGGHPNVFKLSLEDGTAVQLTDNRDGYMRSYVYYDGGINRGLAKASPSYDPHHHRLLYIQDNRVHLLNLHTLEDEMIYRLADHVCTGFTHISADGRYACIPVIDSSAFEAGSGNPFTRIRLKVSREQIESQLLVIDTHTGEAEVRFSQAGWITHVQFHPADSNLILYNHEGGMVEQRMWLYDHRTGQSVKVRDQSSAGSTLWICHELWAGREEAVLYHGTLGTPNDPSMKDLHGAREEIVSFIGRIDPASGREWELAFPASMQAYGHFMMSPAGDRFATDGIIDGRSIHLIEPDWEKGQLFWTKACSHNSSFATQDVHPHPVFSHDSRRLLFTSDAHNERAKGHLYLADLQTHVPLTGQIG
ncbi:MAG: hypothetical protein K0R57_6616 [Paenibacillaceae bacterium]|jgi:hypothetical protein|nr:hypothetical protein [Paenibacillaceae bacterium]